MNFTLIRSKRRTLAIKIERDGSIKVFAPLLYPQEKIEQFVLSKRSWIEKHQTEILKRNSIKKFSESELIEIKEKAKAVIPKKTQEIAEKYNIKYGKISIRTQRTLWGSCTVKKNLSFNALLILLPEKITEYVIIHELSHTLIMNHSKKFWKNVEKMMPDYKAVRRRLKKEGASLLYRL